MQEIISNLDYIEYEIDENYDGLRIDKALANLNPDLSRNQIQTLIDEGYIICNDKGVKASLKVYVGDKVRLYEKIDEDANIEPENIPLDIVYEDDDLIIINKPKGMVVHPSIGHYNGTLVNALMYHFKDLSNVNGKLRPGIVHRLDMDTSGLLVVAKNDAAHHFLAEQLKDHTCFRKYVCIVYGQVAHDKIKVDAPIGRHPTHRQEMSVVSNGKYAVTHANVIKRYSDFTFIECLLETGRTHQIRVHLKYIGYPILGDQVYGPRKSYGNYGQFLHAKELSFIHPSTKERVTFSCDLPDYFKETLDVLEKNGTLEV